MRLRDHLTMEAVLRARYKMGGSILFLLALGCTVWLAVTGSSATPPSAAQSAILVLIAAFFQGFSVFLFGKDRPSLATTKTAVRHIVKISNAVTDAQKIANAAVDDGSETMAVRAVEQLSWRLDSIQNQVVTNLEDWADAYPAIIPTNERSIDE